MRIKEIRFPDGRGFGGAGRRQSRVRDLEEGEQRPLEAVAVADDTPVHDWQDEE